MHSSRKRADFWPVLAWVLALTNHRRWSHEVALVLSHQVSQRGCTAAVLVVIQNGGVAVENNENLVPFRAMSVVTCLCVASSLVGGRRVTAYFRYTVLTVACD